MAEKVIRVTGILETCVYADDLDRAERFYRDVLGLSVHSRQDGRHVFFRCGDGMFLVFNAKTTEEETTDFPKHGSHGPGHVAFAVPAQELESWKRHVSAQGVTVEHEITWPGGGRSIYFRDPAHNSVELATPEIWRKKQDESA